MSTSMLRSQTHNVHLRVRIEMPNKQNDCRKKYNFLAEKYVIIAANITGSPDYFS